MFFNFINPTFYSFRLLLINRNYLVVIYKIQKFLDVLPLKVFTILRINVYGPGFRTGHKIIESITTVEVVFYLKEVYKNIQIYISEKELVFISD